MEDKTTKYESSVLHKQREEPKENQFNMPTWGLIFVLIIAFVLLKSFIYIKDEKRHGK